MIILKTDLQVKQICENGKILREAVNLAASSIIPGKTTTKQLNSIIEKYISQNKAIATFKGYGKIGRRPSFPAGSCISKNDILVHGIPDNTTLKDGDIVSIDVGVTKNGMIADSCFSFGIGKVKQEHIELLEASKEVMDFGISLVQPDIKIYDLATAIHNKASSLGFMTIPGLYGHGVGASLHESPNIVFTPPPYIDPIPNIKLQKGMVITIEPVIGFKSTQGKFFEDRDLWTLRTGDGSWAAQFEHTIFITENGNQILTPSFPDKLIYC